MLLSESIQDSYIMHTSIRCSFRLCIAVFAVRYNAGRPQSICKYRPEPRRKVSACEICVETATNPSSTSPNLQCNIQHKFVTSDLGGARSRNSESNDMDYDVFSDGGINQKRTGYLFEAAELVSKVCRQKHRKSAVELPQFLSWSELTSGD